MTLPPFFFSSPLTLTTVKFPICSCAATKCFSMYRVTTRSDRAPALKFWALFHVNPGCSKFPET